MKFDEESLISYMVWFKITEMSSGSDLDSRSGITERVEMQRSGYKVPSHTE